MGDAKSAEPSAIETELAGLIRARSFEQAATQTLAHYGPELYGFLINLMSSEPDAAEVFSQVTEDLWRGLPQFAFRCSIRTWLYVLARNAGARFRRTPWNRGGRTSESHLDAAIANVRSRTDPWQRTDVKDRWHKLRESLEPDDRTLLVLRIDRDLPWNEAAKVTLGNEDPDPAELVRETARLRKRFQFLKQDLRRRAIEAGLIEDAS